MLVADQGTQVAALLTTCTLCLSATLTRLHLTTVRVSVRTLA